MRLREKVAVVTGAGSGIGRATALLFSEEGAKVAIVEIDRDRGQETVDMIREKGQEALLALTDITDPSQVKSMVTQVIEAYQKINILVNNAGRYVQGDVIRTKEEQWDKTMAVNLRAAFLCCKYCILPMIEKGGGVVINVSSEAGIIAIKNQIAYNVSKAGLISLTKSIALDFASQNIRANCVCPGTTETLLVASALAEQVDPERARRELEKVRPANRLGKPEEIAYGILYLASDESPYATGAVLSVDGGYTAQ
jgi:NAD(P)-dependent dehydrogenase (short-subunit alcohol dehydrogenase family)